MTPKHVEIEFVMSGLARHKKSRKAQSMKKLSYEGLVEQWKTDMIANRAKRMGFRRDEIEDLQQTIIIEVIKFKFDTSKSNGASERTVFRSLIDNQLKKICRLNMRYQTRINTLKTKFRPLSYQVNPDRKIDLQEAINQLSEREQKVCHELSLGRSKAEIAQILNCGWHTVDRSVHRIRESFEDFGLGNYLCA